MLVTSQDYQYYMHETTQSKLYRNKAVTGVTARTGLHITRLIITLGYVAGDNEYGYLVEWMCSKNGKK